MGSDVARSVGLARRAGCDGVVTEDDVSNENADTMARLAVRHPELRVPCPCDTCERICEPCLALTDKLHTDNCATCRGGRYLPLPLGNQVDVDRAVGALLRVLLPTGGDNVHLWRLMGHRVEAMAGRAGPRRCIEDDLVTVLARALEAQP